MKTVVTGGAGFIGSHLVDRLLRDGHEVIVIDNFSTGRISNIEHNLSNPSCRFEQVDITDIIALEKLFKSVDWVFHMAGLADIVPSIESPVAYHRTNVDGTVAVLEACRKNEVRKIVYAASSSCYGLADQIPTPETALVNPMYPYALTKYIGEQYVLHWWKVYGIPAISLRLFNVYGTRSRTSGAYGAVFGVFLAQKLGHKPFTVVGDGSQTRDFTFVTDVAESFLRAAQSDIAGEIFNVGSGGTYSINQLVGLLGGDVVNIPKRPGEPNCTFADIAKIENLLDWHPSVAFETGVSIMVENIESWKDSPIWDAKSISNVTQQWFKYLG